MPIAHAAARLAAPPAAQSAFLQDVWSGLGRWPKSLPCKYLYDDAGSRLFERICQLPEYYLTRCELAIMREHVPEIARRLGDGVLLIEYGSGSGVKTRLLLDHLRRPCRYVPVDIAAVQLRASARRLARECPQIEIAPLCADFTRPFDVPPPSWLPSRKVVYCPGSTIGNFERGEALGLLSGMARLCGPGGDLLIGIDLKKDPAVLEAAYNDSQGVTAEFNRNLLRRVNRELRADFRPGHFRHRAVYSPEHGRVELGLVSRGAQGVSVAGRAFRLAPGEEIRTEYSHKYTVDGFGALAGRAGFRLSRWWTDSGRRFAVLHFVAGA